MLQNGEVGGMTRQMDRGNAMELHSKTWHAEYIQFSIVYLIAE